MTLLSERPLILITGISAAGKSTVADLLARRFERGVHVKGDVYRRMVVAGGEEMTAQPSEEAWRQLRLRYRLGAMTADSYHEAGFAVVVQDVVIGSVLSDYVASIRARPFSVVVLAPRPEVVAQREADRSKVAYRVDADGIAAHDLAFRRDTPPLGLWIDNSDQEPDETVDEIIERAGELGRIK